MTEGKLTLRPAVTGALLIMEERSRQEEDEGYSEDHDREFVNEELAQAAAFYAIPEKYGEMLVFWPFKEPHKKHKHGRIRQLVIAGALIAAEIDRLTEEFYDSEEGSDEHGSS
jgi:hypothetical protein